MGNSPFTLGIHFLSIWNTIEMPGFQLVVFRPSGRVLSIKILINTKDCFCLRLKRLLILLYNNWLMSFFFSTRTFQMLLPVFLVEFFLKRYDGNFYFCHLPSNMSLFGGGGYSNFIILCFDILFFVFILLGFC